MIRTLFISLSFLFVLLLLSSCKKNNAAENTATPLSDLQDVQYGIAPDSGAVMQNLLFDIYFPAGATTAKKYPLVMMIHGGGFTDGDKNDMRTHCKILADSGFIAVSLNYRMGWRKGTGNCDGDTSSRRLAGYRAIQDANAAFRFLLSKASNYAIDVNNLFIGGASAGGGISLMTTYIPNSVATQITPVEYNILGAVNTSGNNLTNTFTIKAVLNLWGALPDSNLVNASSAVPMLLFHGTNDGVVPYDYGRSLECSNYAMEYGSVCLTRRLNAAGKPFILHLKQGGTHGPDMYGPTYTMPLAASFFRKIINGTTVTSKLYLD